MYNATSTRSYMDAMEPLMENVKGISISSQDKIPIIDNEPLRYTPVKDLLSDFVVPQGQFKVVENSKTVLSEISSKLEQLDHESGEEKGFYWDMVVGIITSTSKQEELQSELFNLLGFEELDLMTKVVQNKSHIVSSMQQKEEKGKQLGREKLRILTPEERIQMLENNQRRTKNQLLGPRVQPQYPHVFKKPDSGGIISITGKKFALPDGAQRTSYANYEEISIPIQDKNENKWISDDALIILKDLDLLCQKTFKNYKTFNEMQSLVYPVAYNTNENMLVCAPTGAGKTDVALLTILQTIKQFSIERETDAGDIVMDIEDDEFKIVYVAPLKALAAEIVEKYSKKLQWLGITVRELTGDMQLTKVEIMTTQVIVTTPEKWDVVTRKSIGDNDLTTKVKLLIIDEVHLLHEDRGSVIETLVARTLRQVESSQSMIRVVGLSATLPNYMDVSDFLGVNRNVGMFYFDASFRPVPLEQQLIGVKGKAGSKLSMKNLDEVSYRKLVEQVEAGVQVMVFVNSRKDTVKSARTFIGMARDNHEMSIFESDDISLTNKYKRDIASKNRSKEMKELFQFGFGTHHAGMSRSDRNLTESMFLDGAIKVLCCTATLAWGVNLPAAVVIVKGTQVYNAKVGGFVDLGISDVLQIFGRAGRPQFEQSGTGILCTTSDRLDHYVSLLTQQYPIESKLGDKLIDNLNAEISLGSVTNVEEGIQWLGYTYLMVRMQKNPLGYGIEWRKLQDDPVLYSKRRTMILEAARKLHHIQMIVFDETSGAFIPKDLGRIASEFYLVNSSVEVFNQMLNPRATEADVLAMISMSSEFDGIKFRQEEENELKSLLDSSTHCQVAGEVESAQGKTNILLQAFISKIHIKDSALNSDSNYVAQNSARIGRALFLIGIDRHWGLFSKVLLEICKSIERRLWSFDHPMAQFELPEPILKNFRSKNLDMDSLKDMTVAEIGNLIHNKRMGYTIQQLIAKFPFLQIESEVYPITNSILRLKLRVVADFKWDDKYHGTSQFFWITVEESADYTILHTEKFILNRRKMKGLHEMEFMIPLSDPLPSQIVVRAVSDSWLGSEVVHTISFQHLIRPVNETLITNLLRLQPLPVKALQNPEIESIYSSKFRYFNPMQTMTFFSLYNSNSGVFVGSPTGSGKTVVAELGMWNAFKNRPGSKVVYIAPMKALVRERVDDWRSRICDVTKYKLVELTGDSTPEAREVREADIIVTTPEKFDGISRNWQTRKFVQDVSLVIMDEIHLLASDRGPILEMIVSRMNYISSQTERQIRLLGLSTAISNAIDMAGWLNVREGLFNFPQSVRPVPLKMYIDGFQDKLAFSPLMKTMNKPCFMAIKQHSPDKPVLIFVASRRQTRLTALDLIHLCGMESNPRRFLHMDDIELQINTEQIKDETLKLSLQFGIALHHAGLIDSDRRLSHRLFEAGKVQILVATSTLAWGVNLPAHLVIIKGTQFFDAKIEAYRDMDLTDILQMMGRAGRPAYDDEGVAIVMTKDSKKNFYKHFLNIGFPVESSLHKVLDDHIGAEISAGTIKTRQDAVNFLTWTFLYRRVHNNPTYYKVRDPGSKGISLYLSGLIDSAITNLVDSKCLITGGRGKLIPTTFLNISSYYYLSHKTMRTIIENLQPDSDFGHCLKLLCEATEYNELATRHGEELINMELSASMRYSAAYMEKEFIWDPHVKAFLLIQAFMSRIELPIADYSQDTISVLDQALRIIQAYIDASAELGYLQAVLSFIRLMQCVKQRCWLDDSIVHTLPGLRLQKTKRNDMSIYALGHMNREELRSTAQDLGVSVNNLSDEERSSITDEELVNKFIHIASRLPTGSFRVFQESSNSVNFKLIHENPPLSDEFNIYAPHFPKSQRESWFCLVSDIDRNELFLLKRATPKLFGRKGIVQGSLEIPEDLKGKEVVIYLVNDAMDIKYIDRHKLKL